MCAASDKRDRGLSVLCGERGTIVVVGNRVVRRPLLLLLASWPGSRKDWEW